MISLNQALQVAAMIKERLEKAREARNQLAKLEIEKGEKYEKTSDVDNQTALIAHLNSDLFILESKLAEANAQNTVEFVIGDRKLTLQQALVLVRLWRSELRYLAPLASAQDRPQRGRHIGYGLRSDKSDLFEVPSYDVASYQAQYRRLEQDCTKLSTLIDEANIAVKINFDASEYLG